jgi:hypothetical protein
MAGLVAWELTRHGVPDIDAYQSGKRWAGRGLLQKRRKIAAGRNAVVVSTIGGPAVSNRNAKCKPDTTPVRSSIDA